MTIRELGISENIQYSCCTEFSKPETSNLFNRNEAQYKFCCKHTGWTFVLYCDEKIDIKTVEKAINLILSLCVRCKEFHLLPDKMDNEQQKALSSLE